MYESYKSLTAAEVVVGMAGYALYCGRPIGIVGKLKKAEVVKVGRAFYTLSNGQKVDNAGEGLFGFVIKIAEEV